MPKGNGPNGSSLPGKNSARGHRFSICSIRSGASYSEKGTLSQAAAKSPLFPHGAASSRILNSIFRDSRTRLCSSPTVEPRVPRATPVTPSSSRGRRESGVLFDLLLVSHRISLPPMMRSVGTNSQTSPPDRATGIRFAQAVRFCARDRHRPDVARTVVCSARNGRFGG